MKMNQQENFDYKEAAQTIKFYVFPIRCILL